MKYLMIINVVIIITILNYFLLVKLMSKTKIVRFLNPVKYTDAQLPPKQIKIFKKDFYTTLPFYNVPDQYITEIPCIYNFEA